MLRLMWTAQYNATRYTESHLAPGALGNVVAHNKIMSDPHDFDNYVHWVFQSEVYHHRAYFNVDQEQTSDYTLVYCSNHYYISKP